MRNHTTRGLAFSALWLGVLASTAWGQGAALIALEVFPGDIDLHTSRSRQSFVVRASYADGLTRDVTDQAKATFGNPALVRLDKNVVYPAADGTTELKVEFGGKAVTLPVKVKDAKADRPISFKL